VLLWISERQTREDVAQIVGLGLHGRRPIECIDAGEMQIDDGGICCAGGKHGRNIGAVRVGARQSEGLALVAVAAVLSLAHRRFISPISSKLFA
jgi:hypothetical protein